MLRIGLTGGIGSGKSTVAARLQARGAVVVDADRLAREVVEPGAPGLARITEEFGSAVIAPDGSLDRAALGAVVFADPAARRTLESITHPLIQARTRELFAAAPRESVVVHDVPLLVELGMAPGYHLVVMVHADEQVRHERLVSDRGMDPQAARSRIAAQAGVAQRRAVADVWLENHGSRKELAAKVDDTWDRRLAPYNQNLLTGTRARMTGPARLVPPDPTWPAQAARLIARLKHVLGDRAVVIEHIGSTSVPGLAAKDVIDLQLGVSHLADADDPAFIADLAAAGFPRMDGNTWDSPKSWDPDIAHWQKRFHGGSDPGRIVHLHIREVGSAGWTAALVFRDWLRAEPRERRAYEAMKRQLAGATDSTGEYAEAKEPWFDAAFDRARQWAMATGWQSA
ncbi:dephospho-CoA kinase [Branchiibius hedensis]|uniref:Dephospho-CoA kinase n=1 Tax=Branchiibius hedensis TaxID=672460 RepID=A0A2Y8ZQE6_9MICO|nr:dephospho-CoA kinase [Branchiibius hedensis]PWJ25260.1 dephospho-CoA kinase [Branchiibius hedensis]SSA34074.1 dephospho-CoA kinase [Branchiibius hedensis]